MANDDLITFKEYMISVGICTEENINNMDYSEMKLLAIKYINKYENYCFKRKKWCECLETSYDFVNPIYEK